MKRFLIVLLALSLFTGMAFANIGLTVGAGYVEPNTDVDDDERIEFQVRYDAEFGAIEVFGEVIVGIPTDSDKDGDMSIEVEGMYNFTPAMAGILNFIVDIPFDSDLDAVMWLTPGFQYRHGFGFGDFFARVDLPLFLAGDDDLDAMDFVGLDFTFSLMRLRDKRNMYGTWGFELGLQNWIETPGDDDFLNTMTLTPYIEHEWFYAEVEVVLPLYEDGFDIQGMSIIPEIEVNIVPVNGLSVWFNLPIHNIGADKEKSTFGNDDVVVGFGAGVRFAF